MRCATFQEFEDGGSGGERHKSGFGGAPDGGGASDLMPGIEESGDDRSLEIKMRHKLTLAVITASTYSWSRIMCNSSQTAVSEIPNEDVGMLFFMMIGALNYCESFSELHQKVSACLKWCIIL